MGRKNQSGDVLNRLFGVTLTPIVVKMRVAQDDRRHKRSHQPILDQWQMGILFLFLGLLSATLLHF